MCPTQQSVSIHAPTRGATLQGQIYGVFYYRFNPRTHTGCDLLRGGLFTQAIVSIHAPTRGATLVYIIDNQQFKLFQSTHPHGVRRVNNTFCAYKEVGFNPRTHTGCDVLTILFAPIKRLFQSTHPHGVRLQVPRARAI